MDGYQLRAWRKTTNLTRSDAARLLGVSEKSMWRYETDRSPVPDIVATKTLNITGPVSPGYSLAPAYGSDEHPATHPHLFKRVSATRWERVKPGTPIPDLPPPVPDEKPKTMNEENYQTKLLVEHATKPAPASCVHCGAPLLPDGQCTFELCPGNDSEPEPFTPPAPEPLPDRLANLPEAPDDLWEDD